MKLCDMHTHSDNSFDAKSTVDELCQAALDKGLYAIAVTDHCEAEYICLGENCEFGSFDRQIPQSVRDIDSAKEKYKDRLLVLRGLELGEPMHDPEQTKHALGYADFDFILASVHNLRGYEDFYYLDYKTVDIDEILRRYFDELIETASFEHFDSLAHLTYPLRYIAEREGYYPDLTPYSEQIDRIFGILIQILYTYTKQKSPRNQCFGAVQADRTNPARRSARKAFPRAGRRVYHNRHRRAFR